MPRNAMTGAVALLALALPGPAKPAAPTEVVAGQTTRQELTITNQDVAVVLETRRVDLPAGEVALSWNGVAPSARTETWSLTNAREASVRWLGLTSPLLRDGRGWLAELEGRRVRVERPAGGGSTDAQVVAVFGGSPAEVLFREGNDLVYGEPGARLTLPEAAAGAASRPGLVRLRLSSERAGSRDLTSRYLVSALNWEANYALTLSPDEKSARLEGWFTVENRSGAEFEPSRLRLLAGVLRTAAGPPRPLAYQKGMAESAVVVEPSAAISESRIYEPRFLGRLAPGRTTILLAENVDVPVEKRYLVRSAYWFGENTESQTIPVAVVYHVGAKKIGQALPAGVVRVYVGGGAVFAGEDRIANTPEKTDFEIETSEAFDLTARRWQTAFQRLSPRESESAFEVTVGSRKKENATVVVRESFPGDWTLVQSSVPASRKSARVVEFAVPVAAGGEAKLTYRVRVRMGR